MLDEYRTRRGNLSGWLTADPRIKCLKPAGAFYCSPTSATRWPLAVQDLDFSRRC
jgi:aspartate/methionine/tyrosine aminotransferase